MFFNAHLRLKSFQEMPSAGTPSLGFNLLSHFHDVLTEQCQFAACLHLLFGYHKIEGLLHLFDQVQFIVNAIDTFFTLVIFLGHFKFHLVIQNFQIFSDLSLSFPSDLKVIKSHRILDLISESLKLRFDLAYPEYLGKQGKPNTLIHFFMLDCILGMT